MQIYNGQGKYKIGQEKVRESQAILKLGFSSNHVLKFVSPKITLV